MATAKVVVCTSDAALLARIRGDLETRGYEVLPAADGQQAWNLIRDQWVDLLIADIHASVIDGFQLCRMLQLESVKRHRRLPAILVSPAYRDEMVSRLARAVGAWLCIQGALDKVVFADLATEAIGPRDGTASGPAPAGSARGWIVLAEDDLDIQRMIATYLGRQGFEVLVASDGEEAERKIQEVEPDLLIIDYMLPKKDGLEVVKWARQIRPQMAIIMVTAHSTEGLLVELLRAGVDDFLAKPFEVATIGQLVDAALKKASVRNIDVQFRAMALELFQVHQRVVRSERLAVLGEIGLAVRHEVNNPLTALLGQSEILLSGRTPLAEDVKRRMTTIRDMALRIRDIVSKLEDIKEDKTTSYVGDARMTDLH